MAMMMMILMNMLLADDANDGHDIHSSSTIPPRSKRHEDPKRNKSHDFI